MNFTDETGDVWHVEINEHRIAAMQKVIGPQVLTGPFNMPNKFETLLPCIYVACLDDCERRGIEPEQFMQRLIGPTLDKAVNAFVMELAAFFLPTHPEATEAMLAYWLTTETSKAPVEIA